MDIAISVSNAPDELQHLYRWLRREEDLPASSINIAPRPPGPEDMGALSDVLVVALGAGGAGAVLANSLSVWILNRKSDLKLRFSGRGGTYELEATRIKDVDAVIEALRKAAGQ